MMAIPNSFPRSFPIIQQLKGGEDSTIQGPIQYIDDTLAVLGAQVVELERRDDVQDKGIRREFINQRNHTDDQFKDQRTYINSRFEEQHNYVDDRFEVQRFYLDRRFEEQRTYMDKCFEKIDVRFEKIDERFEKIDERFEKMREEMRGRFQEMGAFRFNALATRGSSVIHPVPIVEPGGQYKLPGFFPRTVFDFWKLRSPQNAARLFYLCEFYEIEWSEDWRLSLEGEEASGELEQEPETFSSSTLTLEKAVRRYPAVALEVLAGRIGLDYTAITGFMIRWSEFNNRSRAQTMKRQLRETSSGSGEAKRESARKVARVEEAVSTRPRNKVATPEPRISRDELLKDLLKEPSWGERFTRSEPSAILGWKIPTVQSAGRTSTEERETVSYTASEKELVRSRAMDTEDKEEHSGQQNDRNALERA